MNFIKAFFIAAAGAFLAYYGTILALIHAPVPAEYWVGEMITVKRELVKKYHGQLKIIVAGGSSTLFGVDTEAASRQLGLPVVNFGLHAGLTLEKILRVTGGVCERGDVVVLLLEPPYFDPHPQLTEWQITNLAAWDREGWRELSLWEKGKLLRQISPAMLKEMAATEYQRRRKPKRPQFSLRLAAVNPRKVLAKFNRRTTPAGFDYSAYHLNDFGDMQKAEGAEYSGPGWAFNEPAHVDAAAARALRGFIEQMRQKNVQVYFANTPYIATEGNLEVLRQTEQRFLAEFKAIGKVIDRREDAIFERDCFFNTNLHLNTKGRALRTERLLQAIRQNIPLEPTGIAGQEAAVSAGVSQR